MFLVRLFLRVGISIIVLLVALIWASTVASSTLRMDDMNWRALQRLDYCDLPCWAGITPLETDFNQVEEILATALPNRDIHVSDISEGRFKNSRFFVSGDHSEDGWSGDGIIVVGQERVQGLGLHIYVPLWFLFERFDTPDYVTGNSQATTAGGIVYEGLPNITLYWIKDDLVIVAVVPVRAGERLRPDAGTLYLHMASIDYIVADLRPAHSWRGFVSLRRYDIRPTLRWPY